MPETRRIIIVGAGLGGMAAAVGLIQRGFEVELYEQSRAGSATSCPS
jgi:2-polyprenyl-6-methoxyphenol hydroxylase-like FAD-dependent oxidoreductase